MTKKIEVTIDALGFRQIENFVDELSNELHIENTYYGNILASLAHLFEHAGKSKVEGLLISFESGHDGLVFEVNFIKPESFVLSADSQTLLQHLTDDIKLAGERNVLQLFFDTKSVFSLMANRRAGHLKEYLKSSTKSTKSYNDSLQRG